MKRLFNLARVLRKCSETGENESDFVSNLRYVFPVLSVLIAAGLFYLSYHFADMIELYGGAEVVLSTTMLVVFTGCILLSVIELINTLYMSTDTPLLVSMPLTVYEIVGARIYNVLIKLIFFDAAIIIPACLGFGIATGQSLLFFLTAVLGFLIIPLISIMMITALIILLLSVIRVFRNRDMLTIIGILCVPLLSFAYIYLRQYMVQEMSLSAIGKQALTAMQSVSGISGYVPVISFLTKFYETGNILFLLGVIGMLVVTALILVLFTRFFYLKGALSMHTGSNRHGSVDLTSDRIKKKSSVAAMTKKELLIILRTPAYMLYGWLCSTFWPVILIIAILVMNSFSGIISQLTEMKDQIGIGVNVAAIACCVAIFIALFTVAMNNVAYTAISREGSSHYISKIIPVTFENQMRAKRNAGLIICGISSIFYTILGMVYLMIKGLLPFWAVFPVFITLIATVILGNSFQLWLGSRFPNLNWSDESVVGKDASRIFWIIMIVMLMIMPVLMIMTSGFMAVWLAGLPIITVAAAFFMNRFSIRASAKVLAK